MANDLVNNSREPSHNLEPLSKRPDYTPQALSDILAACQIHDCGSWCTIVDAAGNASCKHGFPRDKQQKASLDTSGPFVKFVPARNHNRLNQYNATTILERAISGRGGSLWRYPAVVLGEPFCPSSFSPHHRATRPASQLAQQWSVFG